jgi:WD40 repeat protein
MQVLMPVRKSPFKFLDPFGKEDREIYFGREKEIDELYHRLFESRILIVYGESGTGKSSLVNCGLTNKFRDTDCLPIYIRRSDNILESISEAMQNASSTPAEHKLLTALLFKKALRSLYLETGRPVFFIFDQFEELFIFGTNSEIQSLVQVVRTLVESDIECRFIFIIREEYFANIAEFEKQIPNFLSNRMRIERMDRTNAAAAINGPCNVFGIRVEDGFAEELLKKLNPDSRGIELTYLQIFLDKIFNLAVSGKKADENGHEPVLFTIGLIEKAGDVSDLLGNFLDEQISLFGNPETALGILKSFVSYKGTRRQLNLAEVKDYANSLGEHVREKDVVEIIGTLVHLRILCEKNEKGCYELRHDALAAKIFEKVSADEIEILEVRQFIENAHYFWKKHGVLLSQDDLKYIDRFEKRLSLSEEQGSLISMSRGSITRSRTRRRNIILTSGVIIILLLSVLSVWALIERNRSQVSKIKALAEKYNFLATNVAVHDPTKGIRLAEYAYSLDSTNANILSNINSIYSDNIFYTLIARQEKEISSVAFSPDGRNILTGSMDASARLWDLKGNLIRLFIGHSGNVSSVALAPNGQSILTGSSDRTARLWDLEGNIIQDFKGHNKSVNAVAFSPDGRSILTGSSDYTARLWDLEGNVIQIFNGHTASVNSVAFSPDGQKILTGSSDSSARLWSIKGDLMAVFKKHSDAVNTVAFSPDGQKILTGSSDNTAALWDLNGKVIRSFTGFPGEVNSVVFSPDGKRILAGASAGYVILLDLDGNQIKEFKGHTIKIKAVAFSPDGNKVVTCSGDCTVKLWDLNENMNQVYNGHTGSINSVEFSQDGRKFLTSSSDKTARIWDINGNTIMTFRGHSSSVNDARFSPDGQKILTGSSDGTAKLWDNQGNVIKVFSGHKSDVMSVAFSPDGQNLLTGSSDATAILWNIKGDKLTVFRGHSSGVKSVAFSPDGQKILTGSYDNTARLWDLNGNTLAVFKGHSSQINSVAFSPDGQNIITGSYGSDPARLWDLKGKLVRIFKGHTTSIFSLSFSRDGKKIISGSADQTAILWDINGNIEQIFPGYKSYVNSVCFSPDSRNILAGMENGSVRLYPVKMLYDDFKRINNYEKFGSSDRLQYGITDFNHVRNSENEKELTQAADYYLNEAIQSSIPEKSKNYNNAEVLYEKLIKENPEKTEYFFNLLNVSVSDFESNPNDKTMKEIEEINQEVLKLKSVEDLTFADYAYCLICISNDSTITRLKIPDCFLQICNKILNKPDLNQAVRKDISRWCFLISWEFIQKKEYYNSLRVLQIAQLSDSTNNGIRIALPFAYVFNNRYNDAEKIFKEFKDRPLTAFENFKTYGEAYQYIMDFLEDRAITHPDLVKVKGLLKN